MRRRCVLRTASSTNFEKLAFFVGCVSRREFHELERFPKPVVNCVRIIVVNRPQLQGKHACPDVSRPLVAPYFPVQRREQYWTAPKVQEFYDTTHRHGKNWNIRLCLNHETIFFVTHPLQRCAWVHGYNANTISFILLRLLLYHKQPHTCICVHIFTLQGFGVARIESCCSQKRNR